MKALDRKLFRDLLAMRGQMLAIVFVIIAGVATYVSMQSVMHALQRTLAEYYRDYDFADGFATVRRAPERMRDRLRAVPGIARVETRVTAPVTLEVPGFDEPVSGKIVSIPDAGQPELNRLFLRSGRLVRRGRNDEVLLNEVFALAHHLQPGDRIGAIINGRRQTLNVVGIALSPEYLLQVQPGTVFPDAERYGVLWMARTAIAAAYGMQGAFNELAFTLTPHANVDDVIRHVDLMLTPYGGSGAIARRDQPSHFFITEEFKQLRTTSTMLPVIFIAVAAFLLNVVVSRLISLQREQIGALKAFGYRNLDVGIHYLKMVLIVALIGAAGGTALGLWLGRQMGLLYLEYYRFPWLDYSQSIHVVVEAVMLTTGAVALGVLQAVLRAVRLAPAVAMREPVPALYRTSIVENMGFARLLDQPTRMIVRNINRRPLRAFFTVAGVASACAILIMGLFSNDSFQFVLHAQYAHAQREDLTVTFTELTSTRSLQELKSLPGVYYVEPYRYVPVRLRFQHRRYDTGVEGVPRAPYLRRVVDRELQPISMPDEGIVLTERLAQILGARVGDEIIVEVREGARSIRAVTVAALTRQYIGVAAYMDLDALNRLAGSGQAISGAQLMTDARYDDAINDALEQRPRVAAIVSQQRSVAALLQSYRRTILTFAFILTLFAGVISFGVVYNSARIALSERDRELASLRVLGFTRGEVAYILLGEQALLTLAAIPVGVLLGVLASAAIVAALQTDLYQFPLTIGSRTVGLAAAVVIVSAVASALIVRYRLNRLNMVGVLKTRE